MRLTKKSTSVVAGWDKLWPWISAYLHDKTTPSKVVKWTAWAHHRMSEGWTADGIKAHIEKQWKTHALIHDVSELDHDLEQSLREVYALTEQGWIPAQCAVVYRSLFRAHPSRHWLSDWAQSWEDAGDDWKKVVPPGSPLTAGGIR